MRKPRRRSASRYREADQRLCFRYTDSTMPLLPKSKISSLKPSSVAVQPGLCRTMSETTTLVFSIRGSSMLHISVMIVVHYENTPTQCAIRRHQDVTVTFHLTRLEDVSVTPKALQIGDVQPVFITPSRRLEN